MLSQHPTRLLQAVRPFSRLTAATASLCPHLVPPSGCYQRHTTARLYPVRGRSLHRTMSTPTFSIRQRRSADLDEVTAVCYAAFNKQNESAGKSHDFPTADAVRDILKDAFDSDSAYNIVAEDDSSKQIVGSCSLEQHDDIAYLAMVNTKVGTPHKGVGRALVQQLLEFAKHKQMQNIRLVTYMENNVSVSLYTKLGFSSRIVMAHVKGSLAHTKPSLDEQATRHKLSVRLMTANDVIACGELYFQATKAHRAHELKSFVEASYNNASVIEQDGNITGYCSSVNLGGHTCIVSDDRQIRLLAAKVLLQSQSEVADAAPASPSWGKQELACMIPIVEHSELLQWALNNGMQIHRHDVVMAIGELYQHPSSLVLPSIEY